MFFMAFRQDITRCFAAKIGERGLPEQVYAGVLARTGSALGALGEDLAGGKLPFLELTSRTDDLDGLEEVANRFRRDFADVVILATGGSSLGGKSLYALADAGFAPAPDTPRLHFIDNVDPRTFEVLFRALDVSKTGFLVISKSGTTAETLAQFNACMDALAAAVSWDAVAKHVCIITEPGDNPLRRLAAYQTLQVLDHDPRIAGRFSVFSLVGLLPAMIAGLDVRAVRAGAEECLRLNLSATNAKDAEPSPAAEGAALNIGFLEALGIRTAVLMPYADRLSDFALWYCQLWAESLGKDGNGTTPIPAMGTRDQHSQLQLYLSGPRDKIFTLITLEVAGTGPGIGNVGGDSDVDFLKDRVMGDLMDAEQRATIETLAHNGCPVRVLTLPVLDEKTMGALMMHFMLETVIAAHLLGVNPYDQPAVEEGKILTREYLAEGT